MMTIPFLLAVALAQTGEIKKEETKELERQLARELGAPDAAAANASPTPTAPPQRKDNNARDRLSLLPDISAIGSFTAVYDTYDVDALSPRGHTDPVGP